VDGHLVAGGVVAHLLIGAPAGDPSNA